MGLALLTVLSILLSGCAVKYKDNNTEFDIGFRGKVHVQYKR